MKFFNFDTVKFLKYLTISILFYILGTVSYENWVISSVNNWLLWGNNTLQASFNAERELFKQCEAGTLKEYRIKKKEEFYKIMSEPDKK